MRVRKKLGEKSGIFVTFLTVPTPGLPPCVTTPLDTSTALQTPTSMPVSVPAPATSSTPAPGEAGSRDIPDVPNNPPSVSVGPTASNPASSSTLNPSTTPSIPESSPDPPTPGRTPAITPSHASGSGIASSIVPAPGVTQNLAPGKPPHKSAPKTGAQPKKKALSK